MNRKALRLTIAGVLLAITGTAIACEYKAGETKFLDYAYCRYGEDNIEVVELPEDSVWRTCIYYIEVFRPPKLLAVTRTKDGKEISSINDRTKIGNPCYLTKQRCDDALEFKSN
ncbi:MAG TPA: hypothetical protein VIS57_12210 [Xanthomonadales bacterium]